MRRLTCCFIWLAVWCALPSLPVLGSAAGWSPIQNLTPIETARGRDARDPDVYVDSEGVVHVVFRERDIFYLQSRDNGKTWSQARKVSTTRVNQAPTIVADEDGIHVIWCSLEIAPEQSYYQLYYARSENGGLNWTAPEQLTQFESSSTRPYLMRTNSGLTVVWFELDARTLPFKEQLDMSILQKFSEGTLSGEVPREYREMLRSTIYYMESRSGGRTWSRSNLIFEVLQNLDLFVPFQISRNAFGVYWKDDQRIRVRVTRDAGLTWSWDFRLEPFLDPLLMNQVVYTPEGTYLLGVKRDPFASNRLRWLDIESQEEEFLTQPVVFRSAPRANYGNDEVHVVASLSDEFNTWIAYLRTDSVPPTAWFTEPEDGEIKTETFRIAWDGEDDISEELTFSYLPHGETQWSLFEPGRYVVVQTPPDGEYTFMVRAKDEAGNIQPDPAILEFNTYHVPPNTIFDPPPPPQVFSRSVDIGWTAYDNTQEPEELLYSYSLNDEPWTEFGPQRRQTFRNLLEGPHRIRVRAMDHRENIDESPAEAGFEVIIGIQLAFKTSPTSALNQDRISISWTGSDQTADQVPLYYSYRMNTERWSEWSLSDTVALEDLTEGWYLFEVRARDDIGNEVDQPLVHEFMVDMTPPQTVAMLDEVMVESDYAPILALGGTDNLTEQSNLAFEYRISGGSWQDAGRERALVLEERLSPWSVGFTVEVRARDEVGNVDENPAVIDLTFPKRYFEYGFQKLGVSIIYPILFVILALAVLLLFLGLVILLFRRLLRSRKKAKGPEEEDDFAAADEKSKAGGLDEDDDLFGSMDSGAEDDLLNMKFDDEDDDLFD